ncbi:HAD family hydrolase [Edaphocola flava]|uniref:HAD family hydrolase n=1 Tax=Edaphocola flava TaxID=2499629 RepID=UPI00100ABD11|nr:HAD-IA family hydrolase [Edaphocola flava]
MHILLEDIESVIFDMDGVIIDSMHFWQQAEEAIFGSLGITLSPELCARTAAMTTTEVTRFWYEHTPWTGPTLDEVAAEVIRYVGELIHTKGEAIEGIQHTVQQLHARGYRLGLATNAPTQLIPIVLNKLELAAYFSYCASGEDEEQGKPHPAIYLKVARELSTAPQKCLVFEDSFFGATAPKRAGMRVIALQPEPADPRLHALADRCIPHFKALEW